MLRHTSAGMGWMMARAPHVFEGTPAVRHSSRNQKKPKTRGSACAVCFTWWPCCAHPAGGHQEAPWALGDLCLCVKHDGLDDLIFDLLCLSALFGFLQVQTALVRVATTNDNSPSVPSEAPKQGRLEATEAWALVQCRGVGYCMSYGACVVV